MDPEARKVVEMGYGGSERLTMNMGPQHPSAHGVFRAILTLEGETVVAVDAVIGYLHRCHEKLGESLTYTQYPSIASKTDYVAAMTSELAYVRAAEIIGKVDVPKRAQYLRVIVAELQRVASHCLWLGTWCMDMGGALGGGATIFLYCIRERELVLDLFESLVGARLLYGFHQVGGVRYDIPEGWTAQCRTTVDLIEQRIGEYESMLEDNPFFTMRTKGVGVVSTALAKDVGISGPLLRGSGVNFDLRKAQPYSSSRSRRPATVMRATSSAWSSSANRSGSSGRSSTACPRGRSRRGPA
jgi:NADH-quinone oxidoreductase subunit D